MTKSNRTTVSVSGSSGKRAKKIEDDLRQSPAFKNLGKTIAVFTDPKDKEKYPMYQSLHCGYSVHGNTPLVVTTTDGKYCAAEYESRHEKKATSVMRCDIIAQLSDSELKRWKDYKKRHNLSDQQEFEDILEGIREDERVCSYCKTRVFARYQELIDELKCPKCHLTIGQAARKANPEFFKGDHSLPSNFTNAGKKRKDKVEVLSCTQYWGLFQFLVSNPKKGDHPDPVDVQYFTRENDLHCDCLDGDDCEHLKVAKDYLRKVNEIRERNK